MALVHYYPTDYVFDGIGYLPWLEDDQPVPLIVFEVTKWRGVQTTRDAGAWHLLICTQCISIERGYIFLLTMLQLAAEHDALQVIDNQFGISTCVKLIADVTTLSAAPRSPSRSCQYLSPPSR